MHKVRPWLSGHAKANTCQTHAWLNNKNTKQWARSTTLSAGTGTWPCAPYPQPDTVAVWLLCDMHTAIIIMTVTVAPKSSCHIKRNCFKNFHKWLIKFDGHMERALKRAYVLSNGSAVACWCLLWPPKTGHCVPGACVPYRLLWQRTHAWVMTTFAAQIAYTLRSPQALSIGTLILLSCMQSMQFAVKHVNQPICLTPTPTPRRAWHLI